MTRYGGGDVQAKVTLTGAFFQGDPTKKLQENIRRMLEGVAEEGEQAVKSIYPVGPTGHGEAGVVGRVESLGGKKWYETAVISETYVYPWGVHGIRGGPTRGEAEYRGGKTEALHHMFRTVTQQLRSSRAVLTANLTAGME